MPMGRGTLHLCHFFNKKPNKPSIIQYTEETDMKRTIHKPRDPSFVAMTQRKSGAHVKSKKALRRGEKIKWKKMDSD